MDFKVTVPAAGAAGLDKGTRFRSLRSCKLQKGTWIFWLLMPTSFSIQFAIKNWGRARLLLLTQRGLMTSLNDHTPTASDGVRLSPGLRITLEEGNKQLLSDSHSWWKFRYIYDGVLIYQRERHFPQKQTELGRLRLKSSPVAKLPWAQGGHQVRSPAGDALNKGREGKFYCITVQTNFCLLENFKILVCTN